MIIDELKYRTLEALGLTPTEEQARAIDTFCRFMTDRREEAVLLMRGSAGTGKTTLAAAIVRAMLSLQQKLVLMAPTGRAAKVFSLYAGHPAYTIHRRIYRQKALEGNFDLNFNSQSDTLFIVDEASMIANDSAANTIFAGGQLLDDLVRFVYNGRNCRLMLIGDPAQLPPVGEQQSPALEADVLRAYGLSVYECRLAEVLRQSQQSGILFNATRIRGERSVNRGTRNEEGGTRSEDRGTSNVLPQIRVDGFDDVTVVPGDELIESLASSYSHAGLDETLVVTRSNKRANIYNQGIRNQVLGREEELCCGDRLMIVKNNYYWIKPTPNLKPTPNPSRGEGSSNVLPADFQPQNILTPLPSGGVGGGFGLTFLANGDMAVVRRVRNVHEQYGFRFAEVTMTLPDYDDYELTAMVILDTLRSEAPALTREQQTVLYNKVMEDYADIPLKADRLKRLKDDRYYNALQVKFAYAATCHKAQGGQWAHIYIDQGYMTDDMLTPDYLHWLYTAFTRATEHLYLVNWPKTQVEGRT